MKRLCVLFFVLLLPLLSSGKTLSENELFYRCYAHITSMRVKRSHTVLQSIISGQTLAVDGCMSVLSKGFLDQTNRISDINDEESKAVLKNFTNLHMTFFENQSLNQTNSNFSRVQNDIFDEQSSALFYTKVLFQTNRVDEILKGDNDLEGIRSMGRPDDVGYSSNINKNLFTYYDGETKLPLPNVTFVETGDIIGVKPARVLRRPAGVTSKLGDTNLLNSIGGGLLGSRSYLQRSAKFNNTNFDGANRMNRGWANTVLKDFLCKSLPAARRVDGQRYKFNDPTSSFRKSDGCIQCHVTMDQLAAGGRGLKFESITKDNAGDENPQFNHFYERSVTRDDAPIWPEKADNQYNRRPSKGALFYRTYDGKLIHKQFSNFTELADSILETDDYYACVAKKYYEHFTGVSASLADIGDPFSTVSLNKEDLFHRSKVIELGKALKENKSTYKLIENIIKSDSYRQENFSILGKN